MSAQGVCSLCGFDVRSYQPASYVLPPFSILHGNYLVGRVLGEGGFGITYIAYDMTLHFVCAVKEFFVRSAMMRNANISTTVTKDHGSQDPVYRASYQKFIQEAQTLVRLNKLPNIVRVYTCFEENGTAYFVMDYLSGPTLREYVKQKGGTLSWAEMTRTLTPAIRSLQKLHEKEVLHRDISPDNLMFDEDGELYVLDFGGARQAFATKPGVTSSVSYMKVGYSPLEQIRTDAPQGPWTDVYALTATMYFCLVGKAPVSCTERALGDELIIPEETGLTRRQEQILRKGLELTAEKRYAGMGELLADLEKADEAEKGTPPEEKGAGSGTSQKSRKGLVAALLAGLILLAGGGAFFWHTQHGGAGTPETEAGQKETAKQTETTETKPTEAEQTSGALSGILSGGTSGDTAQEDPDAAQSQTATETQTVEPHQTGQSAETTQTPETGQTVQPAQKKDTYTVLVHGGSGSGEYRPGDRVNLIAESEDDSLVFQGWVVDDGMALPADVTSPRTYFFMPSGDMELTAQFESKIASQNGQNVWSMVEAQPEAGE